MSEKVLPVWIQMLTDDERVLMLWQQMTGQQGGKDAPKVHKYGWAKDKVTRFLGLQGDEADTGAFGFIVSQDLLGRTRKQIYNSLWMAINKYFYDDPVRVKVYDDTPDIVWLERTDRQVWSSTLKS